MKERVLERLDAGWFARHRLGFDADPMQLRVLRSTAGLGLINCCRQWGKSSVTAVKAVHRAALWAESLVLVASPSGRQSAEFMRKVAGFVRRGGFEARVSELCVEFRNGSRVVGVPDVEGTVRGFSEVKLLLIDEAARVSDDLYQALRPMLAVSQRGSIWMMSTPRGRRGFFWEEWSRREGEQISVPATECPRIPAEFLDRERARLTEDWFRQEYLCQFVSDSYAVFDPETVEAAIDYDLQPLWPVMGR